MSIRCFCLLLSLCALVRGDGLVPNWDFETTRDGSLANWRLHDEPIPDTPDGVQRADSGRVSWAAESAGAGKRCLRIDSNGEPNQQYTLVAGERVPVLPNTEYEINLRYRATGLRAEDDKRETYAAVVVDLFLNKEGEGRVGGVRLTTHADAGDWATLDTTFRHAKTFTTPDTPGVRAVVRLQLANKVPNHPATAWFDDVILRPVDPVLGNPGFEEGEDAPMAWRADGSGSAKWVTEPTHGGKHAASVSDAGGGRFSGWLQTVPVRDDRKYSLAAWVKGAPDLNPDGFVGGGATCIVWADADGQEIGEPVISAAVGAGEDWRRTATPSTQPPPGAVVARLFVGLQFCRGSAWFDDVELVIADAPVRHQVMVVRDVPAPDPDVLYQPNLLVNGTVEAGADGAPANWTYVGKATPDWTPAEIEQFHTEGRPKFSVGRGRGEWSHGIRYAGDAALLDIAIDPPLSPNHQWYGRMPVDGFWLSDPMPCEPDRAYVAGGWIRPGAEITSQWFGPLEIRFYDQRGRQLDRKHFVRSSLSDLPAGEWNYWATMPSTAPAGAVTMRLRVGHELIASKGGMGRTYTDNLALWEVPAGVDLPDFDGVDTVRYYGWFFAAHKRLKPPYVPAPAAAPEYVSARGKLLNLTPGNLYRNPATSIPLNFEIANLLGEARDLTLEVVRTDWLGNAIDPVVSEPFTVHGYSTGNVLLQMPPSGSFGAFHLAVKIREGKATVGEFAGRYAVLPPLLRPRTGDNRWGVTPLVNLDLNGRPFERELAELLRVAGFGHSWVRMKVDQNPDSRVAHFAEARRTIQWYKSIGIEPVLQLMVEWPRRGPRTVTYEDYRALGVEVGEAFGDLVKVMSNHNIETANSKSPFRGGGQDRLTDTEYDTIMAGVYDGIKSVAPQVNVLIGNIATDMTADTIKRLYKAPAEGRFDGAVFNAYAGQLLVAQAFLREFDRHGDTTKTVWNEEQAQQRSPWTGPERRYGEAAGARNMVRTWISLTGKAGDRLRCVTMWGFVCRATADIVMVTPDLQPRPQFVAHTVMADALADAHFTADRSEGNASLYQWTRGDGPILVAWASSGQQDLTFETAAATVTEMDLMGNRKQLTAAHGLVTVQLTETPVYLFGGGDLGVSRRLELTLTNGTVRAGEPSLALTITNNGKAPVKGVAAFTGPVANDAREQPFELPAGGTATMTVPVQTDLPTYDRTAFRVACRTTDGAVFAASASLDFAVAVQAGAPPALDGTWNGWETAPAITFGDQPSQVSQPTETGEEYTGRGDLLGSFRLLWDTENVYLGVEVTDDAFVSHPERGTNGFMGDSIEFAFQPENSFAQDATRYEFEMYLPAGSDTYAASRRFPAPGGVVDTWRATVKPTGKRGNAIYQVAVPWADLGGAVPAVGKTISFGVVVNDKDGRETRLSGGRARIRWFGGIDTAKNPELYGDVNLVEPAAE